MKKIFFATILLFNICFGCVCTGDINAGFTNSSTQISNVINSATNIINNNLIKAINRNTRDIKKQNSELEKLLQAYKEDLAQKQEAVFLLERIEKLLK